LRARDLFPSQRQTSSRRCQGNIESVRSSLADYCSRTGEMPKSLQVSLTGNSFRPTRSSAPPARKNISICLAYRERRRADGRVCDLAENHPGGRYVILAPPSELEGNPKEWRSGWCNTKEFDFLMGRHANQAFAKASKRQRRNKPGNRTDLAAPSVSASRPQLELAVWRAPFCFRPPSPLRSTSCLTGNDNPARDGYNHRHVRLCR